LKFDKNKPEAGGEALAKALENLRSKLDVPRSFKEIGVDKNLVFSHLDDIAMRVYEDQCTPANPRVPLLEEIKDLITAAYHGVSFEEASKMRAKGKV
jgi:acetaldehyde dehydrogenase/alcohol dehydrogenase